MAEVRSRSSGNSGDRDIYWYTVVDSKGTHPWPPTRPMDRLLDYCREVSGVALP